ncbi:MAG: CHAT domain-containing tetratricopeptide repeat protein, partial [Bacteroidia bacterium]
MQKKIYLSLTYSFLFLMVILISVLSACDSPQKDTPKSSLPLIAQAKKWVNHRQLDSGLIAYQQLLAQCPQDSTSARLALMNEITHIHYVSDNTKEFLNCLKASKELLQQTPQPTVDNQLIYLLNRSDKAISQYEDDSLVQFTKRIQPLLTSTQTPAIHLRAALSSGFCYVISAKYDSASWIYEKVLKQYENSDAEELYGLLSQVYIARGYIYDVMGKMYEMEQNYEKAYQVAQKLDSDNYFQKKAALYLANSKRKAGKYETALKYYQEALHFFETQHRVMDITQCYYGIANVLVEKGEHSAAIEYYTKCLQNYEKNRSTLLSNDYDYASTFNNLSNAYRDNKNYEQAKRALYKTLALYKSDADKVIPILNLGVLYCFENQSDSAVFYLKKTLEWDKKARNIASFESAQALHWLGVAYQQQGKKTESLAAFEASLSLLKELGYAQSGEHGEIYEAMAEMYAQEKDWKTALTYVQKGLIHVSYQFKQENYATQPTLTGIASPMLMLKLLRKKGKLLYELYRAEKQPNDLVLCLNTRALALDLVDSIRLDYAAAASKLSLMGEVNPLYEAAIETALQLHDLQKDSKYLAQAFSFAERNKATVLNESMQSLKASESAHIPDSLVVKMNDLKTDIGYFEHQLYKTQNPDSLKAIIVELKEKYHRVEEQMEEEYPDYHKVRYNFPKINLTEIQAKLAIEKRSLLAFFTGDSALYSFCVNEKTIQVQRISMKDDSLITQLEKVRNAISNSKFASAANPKEAFQSFCQASFYLYKKLIQPFENQINNAPLLILSDGALSYLPFEVLIEKLPKHTKINYQDLPYLIRKYEISYAYSAN